MKARPWQSRKGSNKFLSKKDLKWEEDKANAKEVLKYVKEEVLKYEWEYPTESVDQTEARVN